MKVKYSLVLALVSLFFLNSCNTEEAIIDVEPAFEVSYLRDGQLNAFAGTPIYVYKKGTAEFVSMYTGEPGSVYGEPGAKGVDFVLNDSLPINYNKFGAYTLTFVSTSAAKFGVEMIRDVRTISVNVVDARNSFKTFSIGSDALNKGALGDYINGKFSNDSILFSIPDVVTTGEFLTLFLTDSPDAIVSLNGNTQTSAKSKIPFVGGSAGQIVNILPYKIKANNGDEKSYTVGFKMTASAIDTVLLKFNVVLPENAGTTQIDQANNQINITVNPAIDLDLNVNGLGKTTFKFLIESSLYSSVLFAKANAPTTFVKYSTSTNTYRLTGSDRIVSVKVLAQDKIHEQIYTLNVSK